MKGKNRLMIVVIMAVFLVVIMANSCFAKSSEAKRDFDIDNVLLKLTVKQGESISKTLKVSNTGSERADFKISKEGLDFIFISEEEFSLEPGGEEVLELNFNIENKSAGVYLGEIIVLSSGETLAIPVILEIETKEVLFDGNINVPPEYSSVYPGEKAIIEIQIFNLENIGLKTVKINYFVRDFKGNTIFLEQGDETIDKPSITKIIPIPKNVETGDYVFIIVIEYGDSVGTSSYFFKIADKKFEVGDNLFMWIVIFLLFGLIFFFIYYVMQRDKMFLELERQYRSGMKREVKRQKVERVKIIKLKPVKRKAALRIFRKKKKKRLRAIRKIHRVRVKVLKKLKKQKKKSQALGKLAQWKRQGYNVNEFLIKTAKPEKKDLKSRAVKWRKQGYKIG